MPYDAHLAVAVGQRFHVLKRALAVAGHAVVRNSALASHLRRHVCRGAVSEPVVQVGADGDIPVVGKPPRRLSVEFIPSRHVMREHHRRIGARPVGLHQVGMHLIALVSFDRYHLRGHSPNVIRLLRVPHSFLPLNFSQVLDRPFNGRKRDGSIIPLEHKHAIPKTE